ncbi:hypothetical protein ACHAWF_000853 [Thalassiosira exigua]
MVMVGPLLSPRLAPATCFISRQWRVTRPPKQLRMLCSSGAATTLRSGPSPLPSLSPFARRSRSAGTFASIACSALYSAAAATVALCDDKNEGKGNDEDFISKIRSKMESQSFEMPDLSSNDTVNAIATSLGSQISLVISSGIPTDISYGFFAGYFSGLALKKMGKIASVTLGASFLALQTLAYHGYVDVHHEKLQKKVEELLDRNNDGVVDGEDLMGALEEVKKVAGFGLGDNKSLAASGGGFGLGFWGGLRSG